MDYSNIIKLISNDFNSSFNTSVEIKYDSKEKIMQNNPHFKIGNSATGLYDTKSKTIYFFSDTIEKIREKNYDNEQYENDNGLTFLIFASFHELEHFIQIQYPEKLRKQFKYAKPMYAIEKLILKIKQSDPDVIDFDYYKKHDNFLLEIDADIKGKNNAVGFIKYHGITGINLRYFDLMQSYNDFRINNYDIPMMLHQFIKIIKKYPDILKSKAWLDCDQLIQFFNQDGTVKPINELMSIQSDLTPYFVSSISCIYSLNDKPINEEQIQFINACLEQVIDEHEEKQKRLTEFSNINDVVTELKNYTQVNGNNSKSTEYMANENYYNYIRDVQNRLQDIYIERNMVESGYGK